MTLKNFSLALALVCMFALIGGCNNGKGSSSAAVKKVASLDEDGIYDLPMFKDADKALKKWGEEKSEEIKKKVAAAKTPEQKQEAQKLIREFQLEMQKKQNETMNPLKEKARAAVAMTAKKKGVRVVLDKKIVVFGVEDMTEDVKKLLESGEELTYPEGDDPADAPIGYFDANVIRSLKVFTEVENEILAERNKMIEEITKKLGKNPSAADQDAARKAVEARMESLKQAKMGPLFKYVTDSVADVAKAENLSLVLDTQHVMHGGRNLTELVVDSFLKKVGGGGAPAATATPEAGQ